MRIGILGCGYVGQSLVFHLSQQGHQLHVTTTRKEKAEELHSLAEQVYLLRAEPQAQLEAFLEPLEALFITLACDKESNSEKGYVATAKAVSAALATYGQDIHFIAYTSSISVYGQHHGAWISEQSPLHLLSPKSRCLARSENIYRSLQNEKRKVCILRLGELYGPGRELESRIQSMSGSTLPGKGDSFTNLIHLDDVVEACSFCLDHDLEGIFNLCNHTHVPRHYLYDSVCRTEGWPAPAWDQTEELVDFQQNRRVSSGKLERLGFRLQHPHAFEWLELRS